MQSLYPGEPGQPTCQWRECGVVMYHPHAGAMENVHVNRKGRTPGITDMIKTLKEAHLPKKRDVKHRHIASVEKRGAEFGSLSQ